MQKKQIYLLLEYIINIKIDLYKYYQHESIMDCIYFIIFILNFIIYFHPLSSHYDLSTNLKHLKS
jgi:hypothetical protein